MKGYTNLFHFCIVDSTQLGHVSSAVIKLIITVMMKMIIAITHYDTNFPNTLH